MFVVEVVFCFPPLPLFLFLSILQSSYIMLINVTGNVFSAYSHKKINIHDYMKTGFNAENVSIFRMSVYMLHLSLSISVYSVLLMGPLQ